MPDFDLVAGVARGLFGEPDAGDLRPAISASRNVADIERVHVVDPGDVLDADHTFVARLVREPGRADNIADRVDAGLSGAQPFIDDDMAALDLDTGVFEADTFDIADDADCENDLFNRNLRHRATGFDPRDHLGPGALQGLNRRSRKDLYPLLFK